MFCRSPAQHTLKTKGLEKLQICFHPPRKQVEAASSLEDPHRAKTVLGSYSIETLRLRALQGGVGR